MNWSFIDEDRFCMGCDKHGKGFRSCHHGEVVICQTCKDGVCPSFEIEIIKHTGLQAARAALEILKELGTREAVVNMAAYRLKKVRACPAAVVTSLQTALAACICTTA